MFAIVDTHMTVPAAAAACATATSPSGWNSRWWPTGATITGSEMRVPITVVARSGSGIPPSIRGTNRIRANAAIVSRSARSSPAPPSR